jgi:branched-chain amino acid transport system substrate-binding protein
MDERTLSNSRTSARLVRFPVACLLLLIGCNTTRVRTDKPFKPLPPGPGLPGSEAGGDADFRTVVHRAANPYDEGARVGLESFLAHHPHHHQRPTAVALLSGVLLLQNDTAAAKTLVDENASDLQATEHDFFAGIVAGQLGAHARALELLKDYLAADPPARLGGLPDDDIRRLLRSTLAESLAAAGRAGDAIDQLELYAQIPSDRPAERAFALKRAEEIAAGVAAPAALSALQGRRGLFAQAVLGQKAVAALRARGDQANARQLDRQTMAIRRQVGLEAALPSATSADPLRLGLVVPLSGPQARLGEVVLRGASLVVSATGLATTPAQYRIELRDAATPPERSPTGGGPAAGIVALAREERAIGVVSTADAQGAEFASREGVPLLLLDERSPAGLHTVFALIHTAEARAVALARKSLALGARRFAILGPNNAGGRRLAAAFKRAIEEGGGTVTGHVTYAPNATSFATEVGMLRRLPFEGLFVPDDASRFELVAPALAVADIWPRSPRLAFSSARASASSGPGRRETLLLSTALGVSSKFLRSVERYVQGAMLCPGFYPSDDARNASFVSRFRALFGTLPTATDAYGYDALFVLRGAVERGARTRTDVVRLLSGQTFEGLTGDIRFGADRTRIDPPLVYVVDGSTIHTLK